LKGVLSAIELLPVLRESAGGGSGKFRLMIVGRDNPRRYIRAARRLEVDDLVQFVDYVPDPVPLYAASDVYFHPTFYDSCSLTVIEALASGLPVVTTEKNGAAGFIESRETGWVIGDPRDREEVAQALMYYFDDGVRERAYQAAERFGERLSLETNIDRVVQIYDRVISLSD
jgi:UDP-glucose:(heptosyl)LPS alpha-1,3-glucosyltransferase